MLLDANLLLYAADESSPHNKGAAAWLTDTLNGDRRVAIPWQSIGAFLRISTHPRISAEPLSGPEAWALVANWLSADPVWIPPTSERTAGVLEGLIRAHGVNGNLITDAQLAAVAVENGLAVYSADSDFARFPEVEWINPLQLS